MDDSVLVTVRYIVKPGLRDEFARAIRENQIPEKSRAEAGNLIYEYFIPLDGKDELCLLEKWADAQAIKSHGETAHYAVLSRLKKEYVAQTRISKYSGREI